MAIKGMTKRDGFKRAIKAIEKNYATKEVSDGENIIHKNFEYKGP